MQTAQETSQTLGRISMKVEVTPFLFPVWNFENHETVKRRSVNRVYERTQEEKNYTKEMEVFQANRRFSSKFNHQKSLDDFHDNFIVYYDYEKTADR